MKSQRPYAPKEEDKKIVQIKMMDVLYDSKVSTLIYVRDITNLMGSNSSFEKKLVKADYEDES